MKHITSLLAATLAGLLLALPAMGQGLRTGVSWDWQLQPPFDLSVEVNVLGLDPDAVSANQVARLKARGVTPICYVSVGTREDWRRDIRSFTAEVVGRSYQGWSGERFLDIRAPEVLQVMIKRFSRCAQLGFTAVEPDNIDLHLHNTGFGINRSDVVTYFRQLSSVARQLNLAIAQKNAPDLTRSLAPYADFAMTERCLEGGWCNQLSPYRRAGKAILAAEYRRVNAADCSRASKYGLSLVFKQRELTRWREACGG